MSGIGILAYGSLISDPGEEIAQLIVQRIPTSTPFPVEYARLSRTRGGGPTVVPYFSGKPVKAYILVLSALVALDEAKNLLWRREIRIERSGRTYRENSSPDAVVVSDAPGFCGLDHVLYTDFNPSGKLSEPNPLELAKAAVNSVAKAPSGMDGINYLMDLINIGVETTFTAAYQEQILVLTGTSNLEEALVVVKRRMRKGSPDGNR